ncbi:MAG TPA: BrnT family toxin [Longimicrobiaceae bacterium]
MDIDFEWDPAKAESNARKHGVTFMEAATAFSDPLSVTVGDPRHSVSEERFVLFGRSESGRFLAVMHTERGAALRIISARQMTPGERREYEQGGK